MIRAFLLVGTTGFWLTTMSLLIQKEFFELNPIQTPYEILELHDAASRDEYQNAYLGEQWIGFRQNIIQIPREIDNRIESQENAASQELNISDDLASNAPFQLRHVTYLTFLLLGRENEMMVKGFADLDNALYLKSFSYLIRSKDYNSKIKGNVTDQEVQLAIQDEGSEEAIKTIPVSGKILHSESIDFIWTPKNLRVGKQGNLRLWNPLMLNIEDVHFRVGPKEKIYYDDKETEAFVVYLKKGGIETRTWVNPEGIVLRSETATGLLLEKRPAWEIYDSLRTEKNSLPDLPNLYSVTPNRPIQNPEKLNYLKIKLTTGDDERIVEIHRDNLAGLEKVGWPIPITEKETLIHLQPTEFIQSKTEGIQNKAREIIGDEKSVLRAALKIQNWLYENMTPSPTGSVPSAAQVLQVLKGDCNEYTALFTALTRSIGIPTKMMAGLMYYEDRFFYHAWPEIYVGKWIALDPTINQAPVAVTHIALAEGGVREQVALATQLGRLKVHILETK